MTVRNEASWKDSLYNHIRSNRLSHNCTDEGSGDSCPDVWGDNSPSYFRWRVATLKAHIKHVRKYFSKTIDRMQRFLIVDLMHIHSGEELCWCLRWLLRPNVNEHQVSHLVACPYGALDTNSSIPVSFRTYEEAQGRSECYITIPHANVRQKIVEDPKNASGNSSSSSSSR